ncbi:MAG TPA: hypothetical protein VFB28_00010 [Terriglobales bacterium]|nr:hypothetical protein [Terriglobales bacterium]
MHKNGANGNGSGHEGSRTISTTVKQFLAIGFRHRDLVRTAFLWSTLAALVVVFLFGLTYESDFEILVKHDRVEPAVTPDNSARPQPQGDATTTTIDITNESEILQSEDLLRKVIDACPMTVWGEPKFYTPYLRKVTGLIPGYDESRYPKALAKLESSIQPNVVSSTGLMQIQYTSSDPLQAQCVTNNLSKFYLQKHLQVSRMPKVFDFFAQQTEDYRKKLASAEAALLDFAKKENAVAATNQVSIAVDKGAQFEADLHGIEKSIESTQKRLGQLQALRDSVPDREQTQLRKVDNATLMATLKGTLNGLELDRTNLLTKYDPSYRLVQEVDQKIAQTKALIEAESKNPLTEDTTDKNKVHEWVESQIAQAQADLAGFQAQAAADRSIVKAYKNQALSYDQKGVTQDDLLREVKATEANYLLYLSKREQARIQDMLDERSVLNVVVAEPPTNPEQTLYSPLLLVFLALVFGAFIAAGAALIADYLDPSFRTPDEVREFLEVPVFASIPENGFEVPVGDFKNDR